MFWHFCGFMLLFLVIQIRCEDGDDLQYEGPVVCKGTKPLIIHENRDEIFEYKKTRKQLFEQYWYQMYNHLHGCEIIVGNLIIPHQQYVPFEEHRLNEAIEKIEIVTGFVYIYDVGINLNFKSLKMVYGNELFKYPPTWSGYNSTKDEAYLKEYAIFVEKFTAESLIMPELRYIKNGKIGFKDTPKACVWNPEKELLYFDQFFDTFEPYDKLVHVFDDGKTFKECQEFSQQCYDHNCLKCFDSEKDNCQKTTKRFCKRCKNSDEGTTSFCIAPNKFEVACCPENCYGGCEFKETSNTTELNCFHCKEGYFLEIDTKSMENTTRKCVKECDGKIIDGTDICLAKSNACPDYMFSFDYGRSCSYQCPAGMEFDPINNFATEIGDHSNDVQNYEKYWKQKNICKPCRMTFDTKTKNFKSDCGISCVIQSNSLSFVTILNVYPAVTNIEDYDFYKFLQVFNQANDDMPNPYFDKTCRHISGFLHIDQYSIGHSANKVRLTPEHFGILTYATGLYGSIRIEFTEGYWLADSFRNLLVIEKPIKGKIAYDQEYYDNNPIVNVRYNSDLRTLDLQRLRYIRGEILVQDNPLYIPPVKDDDSNVKIFGNVYGNSDERVSNNGLTTTRYSKKITYGSGCTDGKISYYYKRCPTCARTENRVFFDVLNGKKLYEYFAECQEKDQCKNEIGYYSLKRNGEMQCLKCDCDKPCTDEKLPFTCSDEDNCQGKKINEKNIALCIDGEEECPNGFYQDETICKRCDSACRLCYSGGNNYTFPEAINATLNGCKTCDLIYMGYDSITNEATGEMLCANLGAAPRCPPGEKCHFLITNPVRDLWENAKPSSAFNKNNEVLVQ